MADTTSDGYQDEEASLRERPPLILIAEDDQPYRLLLRRTLETEGYQVIEADDGKGIRELCETEQPELVLLDAVMPEVDGFAACAELRGSNDLASITVIMITSLNDDPAVERAFRVGANDFITKPINISVLKHRVRQTLLSSRAEKKLVRLAHHDSLTGLPNRMLFMDRLNHSMARARRGESGVALLFIDVDNFKMINDTLGHDAGDNALKSCAERLSSAVRQSDTVARLGGDEFTVLLESISTPEDAAHAAGNVLRALSQRLELNGRAVPVSASIGIALFPDDAEDIGSLVKNADTAMYRAKQMGRNNFQFYRAEMSAMAMHHLVLENNVRQAIAREDFIIHYQPMFDLAENKPVGFEALVRWRLENSDIIYPQEFIRLAEDTGLIVPLGEWVLRSVCEQCAAWQAHGKNLPHFAINLSTRQFREPGMVNELESVLKEFNIAPDRLLIEVTEHTLMENMDRVEATLAKLRDLGIGIAIDDFGTGWSSLSYLKRFPIESIKIDHSFVGRLPEDGDAMAIVKASIELGHTLNVRVVAEGVETEAQRQLLKELGCHLGQGHFWAEPVPAADYAERFL